MTDAAPTLNGRLRKRAGWIGGGGLALLVVVALLWFYYSGRESTDDAQIDGHIHPVAARVPGTVKDVNVDDNQFVKAGSLLVQIDPTDYEVALARAKADLAEAQASASAALTNVPVTSTATTTQSTAADSDADTARAKISEAEARLREAQANEAKASNDLTRVKALLEKDEVSRQEYDASFAAAAAAAATLEARRAGLTEAQKAVVSADARVLQARTGPEQVAMTKARAASAQARVDQLGAALEQAKLNLEYTTVKAPVDGVISRKSVERGQIIQGGQPLLAVVPLEEVWVIANFKENQLRRMKPNQPVEIFVDAFGGRRYKGHVASISAATGARFSLLPPENASGNYVKVVQRVPVKIVIDPGQDNDHLLRPGMSVEPVVYIR